MFHILITISLRKITIFPISPSKITIFHSVPSEILMFPTFFPPLPGLFPRGGKEDRQRSPGELGLTVTAMTRGVD